MKLKKWFKEMKKIVSTKTFALDGLFLLGLGAINVTNFMLNLYFGMYFLGLCFVGFSIFLNLTKKK